MAFRGWWISWINSLRPSDMGNLFQLLPFSLVHCFPNQALE